MRLYKTQLTSSREIKTKGTLTHHICWLYSKCVSVMCQLTCNNFRNRADLPVVLRSHILCKTRGVWGKVKSAVNRGFIVYIYRLIPNLGKGNGSGITAAVNRGISVKHKSKSTQQLSVRTNRQCIALLYMYLVQCW